MLGDRYLIRDESPIEIETDLTIAYNTVSLAVQSGGATHQLTVDPTTGMGTLTPMPAVQQIHPVLPSYISEYVPPGKTKCNICSSSVEYSDQMNHSMWHQRLQTLLNEINV